MRNKVAERDDGFYRFTCVSNTVGCVADAIDELARTIVWILRKNLIILPFLHGSTMDMDFEEIISVWNWLYCCWTYVYMRLNHWNDFIDAVIGSFVITVFGGERNQRWNLVGKKIIGSAHRNRLFAWKRFGDETLCIYRGKATRIWIHVISANIDRRHRRTW